MSGGGPSRDCRRAAGLELAGHREDWGGDKLVCEITMLLWAQARLTFPGTRGETGLGPAAGSARVAGRPWDPGKEPVRSRRWRGRHREWSVRSQRGQRVSREGGVLWTPNCWEAE